MNPTRHDFLKGALAALGFSALPGGLFAAPKGWKIKKKPNLIFGILSDTHLQSGWDGVTPHGGFPLTYVTNAMKLFRQRHIDAFMHLGDMAHRGKNIEAQYHRDIFDKFFPQGARSSDKRKVEKLLVVGNHELYGNAAGGAGAWAPHIWKDPEERKKHVLCGDLPKYWERIWGEKYEECWHKEVNGYHFFGRHWTTNEMTFAEFIKEKAQMLSLKGTKPFFILSHARHHFAFFKALKDYPNAVAFFGHWHMSNADWKTIFFDKYGFAFFPSIQVGSCRMDGGNALDAKERVTKGDVFMEEVERKTAWSESERPSRQAMIVNVYDDMVVFERHEVGKGGKLGPDWVMPVAGMWESGTRNGSHPFSTEELKKAIGEPQFLKGAKVEVKLVQNPTVLRIKIPLADGNPDSRVYAYDVVVIGKDPKKRLFKSVYFEGVNLGIGNEPNGGVTTVDIPQNELPEGRALTIAIRPISSLGTKGKAIAVTYSLVTKTTKSKRA
ncbi:MAG: metallophosphoesterase [Kiritimatiellae bacterium]|nr:metallophosphoesterase [Kiritimatiellia bacterium]